MKMCRGEIAIANKSLYTRDAIVGEGRPMGGLMVLTDKDIDKEIRCRFISNRILVIEHKRLSLVIIGSYMPSYQNRSSDTDYKSCLNLIQELLTEYKQKDFSNIMLLGDINCELTQSRPSNVVRKIRKKMLSDFISKNKLIRVDDKYPNKFNYTRRSKAMRRVNGVLVPRSISWLDMVFVNESLHKSVDNVEILDNELNESDHLTLSVRLRVKANDFKVEKQTHKTIKRFKWTDLDFQLLYNKQLRHYSSNAGVLKMNLTAGGNDLEKRTNMTIFVNTLQRSMIEAFNEACIITTKRIKYKKNLAFWDESVRKAYRFYRYQLRNYNETLKNIKSNATEIEKAKKNKIEAYDLFRESQKISKMILKRKEFKKLNNTFCEDIIEGWRLFKRLYRKRINTKLNAEECKKEFEKHFTSKICAESPELEMHKKKVKDFMSNHDPNAQPTHGINAHQLGKILKNLTNGKRPGFSGVCYEMYKYLYGRNWELIQKLCDLFNAMFDTGLVPFHFNIAVMITLVKDAKKDLNDPSNLRPISISDSLTNIFETLVLHELDKYCDDGVKQFGFKSRSSCNHATICLTELIRYAQINNLTLFTASLDASKAFDKVERAILWSILLDMKLPKKVVFIIIKYYEYSLALVEIDVKLSTTFLTMIGVKQGGWSALDCLPSTYG